MIYKTIEIQIWEDKEVHKLSDEGKLLFVYLKTNRLTHYSGIYFIKQSYIMDDLKWSKNKLLKAIKDLQQKPLIEYDEENNIVWVINMLNYSLKIGNKPNLITGTGKHIGTLQKSFTLNNFYNKYKDLSIPIPMGYEWVSHPSNTVTVTDTVIDTVTLDNDTEENTPPPPPEVIEPLIIPDYINQDTWNSFVEMRKEIKKSLTDNAIKLALSKLSKFKSEGFDVNEVLEESILNQWAGLFKPKGKPKDTKFNLKDKDYTVGVNEDGTF